MLYATKDLSAIKDELESGGGEKRLLKIEKNLKLIGAGLGLTDFQYMTFDKQAAYLSSHSERLLKNTNTASDLAVKLSEMQKALDESTLNVTQLKTENADLQSRIKDNEAQIALLEQSVSSSVISASVPVSIPNVNSVVAEEIKPEDPVDAKAAKTVEPIAAKLAQ